VPDDRARDREWEQRKGCHKIYQSDLQRRDSAGHRKLQPEIGLAVRRRYHNRILSGQRRYTSDGRVHDVRDRAPSQSRWQGWQIALTNSGCSSFDQHRIRPPSGLTRATTALLKGPFGSIPGPDDVATKTRRRGGPGFVRKSRHRIACRLERVPMLLCQFRGVRPPQRRSHPVMSAAAAELFKARRDYCTHSHEHCWPATR
jgi:hypothetical protein